MAIEISLEQTNKIRAELGLKLIPVDKSAPAVVADAVFDENIERQLKKLRESKQKRKMLAGKTLVEAPSSSIDFLARIKHMAKPKDTPKDTPDGTTNENGSEQSTVAAVVTASQEARRAHTPVAEPAAARSPQKPPQKGKSRVKDQDVLDKIEEFAPQYAQGDYAKPRFKVRKPKLSKRRKLENDYDLSSEGVSIAQEQALEIVPKPKLKVRSESAAVHVEPHKVEVASGAATHDTNDSMQFLERLKTRGQQAVVSGDAAQDTETVQSPPEILPAPKQPEQESRAETPATPASNSVGLSGMLGFLQSTGAIEEKDAAALKRSRDWVRNVGQARAARSAELAKRDYTQARHDEDQLAAQEDAQLAQQQFKDYEPVVELTRVDSTGKKISSKQAWKELSHRFHGTKKRV